MTGIKKSVHVSLMVERQRGTNDHMHASAHFYIQLTECHDDDDAIHSRQAFPTQ